MNQLKKVLVCMLMFVFTLSLAFANAPDPISWNWETDYVLVGGDDDNPIYEYKKFNEDQGENPFNWSYGVGEESTWLQYGEVLAKDPWVRQTIINNTSGYWSDWHVRVIGGWIDINSIKVYNRTLGEQYGMWVWTDLGDLHYENVNGIDYLVGFDAHTIPGSGMHIVPGQRLRVEFYYEAFVLGQSVSLQQYPTDTYPIPEPGTMAALISGLAGLGVFARRKFK
ncbi:MAG: PEP-CTERM sorting domain-containing protein [Armatimonadota bacterium]